MANKYNPYARYDRQRAVADKIANGKRLTRDEERTAYELSHTNMTYRRDNSYMGRRYKDI